MVAADRARIRKHALLPAPKAAVPRAASNPACASTFDMYVYCASGDYSSDPKADIGVLLERKVGFTIKYERDDPLDPRELSEMPDIRLWFVRLDVAYPWLPVVLDWRGGELGRYAAMLVPHQVCSQSSVSQTSVLHLRGMFPAASTSPTYRHEMATQARALPR